MASETAGRRAEKAADETRLHRQLRTRYQGRNHRPGIGGHEGTQWTTCSACTELLEATYFSVVRRTGSPTAALDWLAGSPARMMRALADGEQVNRAIEGRLSRPESAARNRTFLQALRSAESAGGMTVPLAAAVDLLTRVISDVSRSGDGLVRWDVIADEIPGMGPGDAQRVWETEVLPALEADAPSRARFHRELGQLLTSATTEPVGLDHPAFDAPTATLEEMAGSLRAAGFSVQAHPHSLKVGMADTVRATFTDLLSPTLQDLDPVPHATVEQATRRVQRRIELLSSGAFTLASLAEGRGASIEAIRQWAHRARQRHAIFTVRFDGETLVPAFLLDEDLEPRPEYAGSIDALHAVDEDGWALWTWFASPSGWLDGRTPADHALVDAAAVTRAATRRASNAA